MSQKHLMILAATAMMGAAYAPRFDWTAEAASRPKTPKNRRRKFKGYQRNRKRKGKR